MAHPQTILLLGSDSFIMDEEARRIVQEILPNHEKGGFDLDVVDGSVDTVDEAIEVIGKTRSAMQQTGFFAEDKVVWLRDVTFCAQKNRVSSSETIKRAVDEFRTELDENGVPGGVTLLISGSQIFKNSLLVNGIKRLEKAGKAEIIDVAGGPAAVKKLIKRMLDANGWKMDATAVEAFVARVGADGAATVSEIKKLFAYTGGKPATAEDVDAICTLNLSGGEPWRLLDLYTSRDLNGTIGELRRLFALKQSEFGLITLLESRAADVFLIADSAARGLLTPDCVSWSGSLSSEQIDAVHALGKLDPFARPPMQRGRLLAYARKWTRAQALHARTALLTCHEQLTSVGADKTTLLELAVTDALS